MSISYAQFGYIISETVVVAINALHWHASIGMLCHLSIIYDFLILIQLHCATQNKMKAVIAADSFCRWVALICILTAKENGWKTGNGD